MPQIIIATGNTCYGKLARTGDGLAPFAEAGTDVLTLQELRDPEADTFTNQLDRYNFTLVHAVGTAGLAMAINKDSAFAYDTGSIHHEPFRTMRPRERQLYDSQSRLVGQFPERGLVAARFLLDETAITTATTHPYPPTRTRSRNNQVRFIGRHLGEPRYDGNLVVTGDWNHWPAARSSDLRMRQEAGLIAADIGAQQTWSFRNMEKMQYVARGVSMLRYPTPGNIRSLGDRYLDAFGGQLDAILYRGPGLQCLNTVVTPIDSDHRAVIATFQIDTRSRSSANPMRSPQSKLRPS